MLALIQCYMSNNNSTTSSSHNEDGSTSLYKTQYNDLYILSPVALSKIVRRPCIFISISILLIFGSKVVSDVCLKIYFVSMLQCIHTNTQTHWTMCQRRRRWRGWGWDCTQHTAQSLSAEFLLARIHWNGKQWTIFLLHRRNLIPFVRRREREHMRTFVENNSTISR